MIRLSQRAWNNVIIISMLVLIMLFNFSSRFLNGESSTSSSLISLVPINMTITTMEFALEKVERVGQGWRAKSGAHSSKEIARLVEYWSRAQVSSFEQGPNWQAPSSSSSLTVKLWFAGQALPAEYKLTNLADRTLVKIDKKTYQLTSPSYQMLILPE